MKIVLQISLYLIAFSYICAQFSGSGIHIDYSYLTEEEQAEISPQKMPVTAQEQTTSNTQSNEVNQVVQETLQQNNSSEIVQQQVIKETEKEPEIEIELDHTHDDTTDHGSKHSNLTEAVKEIKELKEELANELNNPNVKSVIQESDDIKIITSNSAQNQLPLKQDVDRLTQQQLEIEELKIELAALENKSH
jgi:hypothetical protein